MDEAEQLCDRLVVMDHGRIVAHGSPRSLIEQYSTREVVELRFRVDDDTHQLAEKLERFGSRVEPLADRVLVYTDHGDDTVDAVHRDGFTPESTLVRRSSLEDVFLRLTGRTLVE